jgi:hypothetical protein
MQEPNSAVGKEILSRKPVVVVANGRYHARNHAHEAQAVILKIVWRRFLNAIWRSDQSHQLVGLRSHWELARQTSIGRSRSECPETLDFEWQSGRFAYIGTSLCGRRRVKFGGQRTMTLSGLTRHSVTCCRQFGP